MGAARTANSSATTHTINRGNGRVDIGEWEIGLRIGGLENASVLRLMGSAAAGPGGRSDLSLGADFGDLRFEPEGYGAVRLHSGRHKELEAKRVKKRIQEQDGFRRGMVNAGRRHLPK